MRCRFPILFFVFLILILFLILTPPELSPNAQPMPPPIFEIWVTNQSADTVQIIDGRVFNLLAEIPVDDDGKPATAKPHTVRFSPDRRYAYVANVGARAGRNNVTVIRTTDRSVVARLPAGPGAHMVMPSPDGKRAFVANAGSDSITEILTDTRKGQFKIGRTIRIPGPKGQGKSHPTCLIFSRDSKTLYVTHAGPSGGEPSGFLAVLDVASGKEVARIPNLGTEACVQVRSRIGDRIYLSIGGEVGNFAVLDTKTNRFVKESSSGGKDPHGLMLTPGENQIWIANRFSNALTVFSPSTLAHIKTYFNIGDKPDLLAFSPDGSRLFVTLRGKPATPVPGSEAGREPGLSVIETDTGRVLAKVPLGGDPHGIGILSR